MEKQRLEFYNQAIDLYTDKDLPDQHFQELFEMIFTELSNIDPEIVSLDHVLLMERAKKYYANAEDFKRAQALKELIQAAHNIFEARAEHLKKLKELQNKYKGNDGNNSE